MHLYEEFLPIIFRLLKQIDMFPILVARAELSLFGNTIHYNL